MKEIHNIIWSKLHGKFANECQEKLELAIVNQTYFELNSSLWIKMFTMLDYRELEFIIEQLK